MSLSLRRCGMLACGVAVLALALVVSAGEEVEKIDSTACLDCHEESSHGSKIAEDLTHSAHEGLECLDCHQRSDTVPHQEAPDFLVGRDSCRTCHEDAAEQYTHHGRTVVGANEDIPNCSDCHGDHDILPSSAKARPHPPGQPAADLRQLPRDIDLTTKYEILIGNPIDVYKPSVHGQATKGGVYLAATCNDCHSTGGTAHRILAPGDRESTHQPLQHPEDLRQVPQGDRGGLLGGDPRQAGRAGRDRRAGVHPLPR